MTCSVSHNTGCATRSYPHGDGYLSIIFYISGITCAIKSSFRFTRPRYIVEIVNILNAVSVHNTDNP